MGYESTILCLVSISVRSVICVHLPLFRNVTTSSTFINSSVNHVGSCSPCYLSQAHTSSHTRRHTHVVTHTSSHTSSHTRGHTHVVTHTSPHTSPHTRRHTHAATHTSPPRLSAGEVEWVHSKCEKERSCMELFPS